MSHHFATNSHHPQFYQKKDQNGKVLETGNMSTAGKFPQKRKEELLNSKYFFKKIDLEESLIDMAACRWERQLKGREDVSLADLVDFEERYMNRYFQKNCFFIYGKYCLTFLFSRYTPEDKIKAIAYLERIRAECN